MPIILIIFIMCGIGTAVLFLIHYLVLRKYKVFIKKNSVALETLLEINGRYKFYPRVNLDQSYTYDNENFYNTISCFDYLVYQLQFIEKDAMSQIGNAAYNKQQYSKYLQEVKSIAHGQFNCSLEKINVNRLNKIEKKMLRKKLHKKPFEEFCLNVRLSCSRMNGDIYARKTRAFYEQDIKQIVKRLNNKRGAFYNDREIWESISRVERGKVSNKIRFAIYQRDGYRCKKCGASNKTAFLEIDHIIPIAKGGKSTYDNLQTLCSDCNYEKGDQMPY